MADPENYYLYVYNLLIIGAGKRSRTSDLLITNELLYQLSYSGVYSIVG